jgi:tetratricopeptide (TPR) repeat protein
MIQTGLWIGVNADEHRALQRLDILQSDPLWSTHAKYNLSEERAIFYRSRREYGRAEKYYLSILTLQPFSYRFHANLSDLYIQMGDEGKAMGVYELMITKGLADAGVHENLAILSTKFDQYEKALHHFIIADSLDSRSADIPFNLGIVIATYGNSRKKALPYFLKTLQRDSLYVTAYSYAGKCYEELGNREMAKKYYSEYARLNSVQK